MLAAPRIHDDFVSALSEYARDSAKVGMPDDDKAAFGPVNNAQQLSRVTGWTDCRTTPSLSPAGTESTCSAPGTSSN